METKIKGWTSQAWLPYELYGYDNDRDHDHDDECNHNYNHDIEPLRPISSQNKEIGGKGWPLNLIITLFLCHASLKGWTGQAWPPYELYSCNNDHDYASITTTTTLSQLGNIFRGRIEYELIYSLRGAKHRVDYSVHIRWDRERYLLHKVEN